MAEPGKGVIAGKLAINVQKKFTRAQEKVMQKLGKADETRDTVFEEMVANFNKQMTEGTKLQRDMKAYLAAVKAMHEASQRLQDCLADMYEPEWFGKEEMDSLIVEMMEKEMDNNMEDTDMLWVDYQQNITDTTVLDMDTYLARFPDIKARIAKRDRKMVDFDSARHHFANVQKGKKKDEAKIAKPAALLEMAAPSWAQGLISAHQVAQTSLSFNQAEEELGRAQKVFEELNVELQDELPVLWDSRVGLYVNTFQSLAGHQDKFHKEMSKLCQNLNDIMTKLDEQRLANEGANHSASGDSPPKRPGPPRPTSRATPSPDHRQHDTDQYDDDSSLPDTTTAQAPAWDSWQGQSPAPQDLEYPDDQYPDDQYPQDAQGGWDDDDGSSEPQRYTQPSWDDAGTVEGQESWNDEGASAPQSYTEPNWDDDGTQAEQGGWDDQKTAADQSYTQPNWDNDGAEVGQGELDDGEDQNAVTNGSDGDLPPGFLYKVKAVHDYAATDGDELELKAGDMVLVLAFDNPDEQDDGWLMGLKESNWLKNRDLSGKGVFPENFTQKV
ncbi:myc box-dependent-interacting protein 1b isoform X2 [Myripristis murdjan]|uniref:myc box-dependent-interacting protein 1b isoform X2 n=1 Tax=Myripristis murdjan TaxID=586833 RepID=UPI001175E76E|nr:myc box-dependent-interacting protein 1-like isoform X2 [Myripristis murdjan]